MHRRRTHIAWKCRVGEPVGKLTGGKTMTMNSARTPGRPIASRFAPAPAGSQQPSRGRAIRILLVDDHAVIRQALRMLLESQPELEVIGDVENGREAVQAVEKLSPDVVLMDVVMPGLNGLEATRQIRRSSPSTRVVMLSGFVDEDQLLDSIRSGASGYIIK